MKTDLFLHAWTSSVARQEEQSALCQDSATLKCCFFFTPADYFCCPSLHVDLSHCYKIGPQTRVLTGLISAHTDRPQKMA